MAGGALPWVAPAGGRAGIVGTGRRRSFMGGTAGDPGALGHGWHRPATGGTSDSGLSRATTRARLRSCVNIMAGTPAWRATANGACAEAPPITGLVVEWVARKQDYPLTRGSCRKSTVHRQGR